MKICAIHPPQIQPLNGLPVIFLAGPIQGAKDWQGDAINILKANLQRDCIIASPRRYDDTWQFQFEQQVDWESFYLQQAAWTGVVLFWLAKEHEHACERAYAQTTRFELGEWLVKTSDNLVIGIEAGFPGAKYIEHRLKTSYTAKNIQVQRTLEDTCLLATKKLESMLGD